LVPPSSATAASASGGESDATRHEASASAGTDGDESDALAYEPLHVFGALERRLKALASTSPSFVQALSAPINDAKAMALLGHVADRDAALDTDRQLLDIAGALLRDALSALVGLSGAFVLRAAQANSDGAPSLSSTTRVKLSLGLWNMVCCAAPLVVAHSLRFVPGSTYQ
jgi:hypothetical protein